MKILLLLTLITAGATAHSISPRAVWQLGNVFQCIFPWIGTFTGHIYYGCYCALVGWEYQEADLDRCCQIHDHCYDQVKKLESCKSRIDDPYTSSYSYSCSGREVTCSDKNNPCEAFICNCDRQVAICFSKSLYNKQYKGIHC